MLKIVSENFIHALLLFLGLFLKISRWVPLPNLHGEFSNEPRELEWHNGKQISIAR